MSAWTHSICKLCWNEKNPFATREPTLMLQADEERCCYCGDLTFDGIYVRDNPKDLRCGGVHT